MLVDQFTPAPGFHILVSGGFKLPAELLYQVMDNLFNDHYPRGVVLEAEHARVSKLIV